MLFWVSCFFLFGYALLIGYYRQHWMRVPAFVPGTATGDLFLSVVIAARNEAHNLPRLLDALAQQSLPRHGFEVIIVDDYSTDDTATVIRPYLDERVQCIQPAAPPDRSSKKRAIETGVTQAKGSLVVVTDADCVPQPRWLELMAAFYRQHQPVFIVAPVRFTSNSSLLGIFQQLDFMMLQGITAASIQSGAHSMCNGANLAYEKKAFEAVAGFAGIDSRASGDDMLLLYKIGRLHPKAIHYIKHPEAIMPTPAQDSWSGLLQQRIRWSSKATYYQDRSITAVLFYVYAFNVWCLALLTALFFNPALWPYSIGCMAAKTVIELALLWPVARFYQSCRLLWYFPWLQPLHILYTVSIGLLSRKKTYRWKGRTTQ